MFKIFLRTLVILLVAGLVAGGIYLFAANGGMSLAGAGGQAAGFSQGGPLAQASAGSASQGRLHLEGGPDGQAGFSLAGLSGVAMQAGKVGLITALVVAVKAAVGKIRRQRIPVSAEPWHKSSSDST